MSELPYAHGGPPLQGVLRAQPADFEVDEVLGFEPAGHGEHAFVLIEKSGANTDWVARQLAAAAGVAPLAVGYAGMKDRHAVTRQAFTVQLPGRADPDWAALAIPGVKVLSATRHDRKLKRGAHRGNRFRIRLRELRGDQAVAEARIEAIRARGVPNYFGEQRFGRDGRNLELALQLFAGRRLPREQRSFALSAARSELFNAALAARVEADTWDRALEGEVWMLAGSQSVFGPEPLTDMLAQRLAAFDIHPTGPMWGTGELRSSGDVQTLETEVVGRQAELATGLERAGLKQERRALRLGVDALVHAWEDEHTLRFEFGLPAGAFATTVLREVCDWSEGAR